MPFMKEVAVALNFSMYIDSKAKCSEKYKYNLPNASIYFGSPGDLRSEHNKQKKKTISIQCILNL